MSAGYLNGSILGPVESTYTQQTWGFGAANGGRIIITSTDNEITDETPGGALYDISGFSVRFVPASPGLVNVSG
jgi:hypothetical protein